MYGSIFFVYLPFLPGDPAFLLEGLGELFLFFEEDGAVLRRLIGPVVDYFLSKLPLYMMMLMYSNTPS